jgi:hypothetical protein
MTKLKIIVFKTKKIYKEVIIDNCIRILGNPCSVWFDTDSVAVCLNYLKDDVDIENFNVDSDDYCEVTVKTNYKEVKS